MRWPLAVLALACITQAVPAAADVVNLPGTQPHQLQSPLTPASQCADCHGGMSAPDGHNYMPSDLWPPSLMANAERDPLFLAALTVAEQDVPTMGNYCLRCHTPPAFTLGHTSSTLDPLTDSDGVSCDSCHRSMDAHATDPMAPYIGDARLFFDDAPAGMQVTRHGPYNDPFPSTRHTSVGDPFIQDPRFCGQCHDVDNPTVHRLAMDGTDTGMPFPLQTTYTEYAQSEMARSGTQTCQSCHMSAETDALPVTRTPGAPNRPMTLHHDFVGGNEMAMSLLKAAYPGDMDDAYDALRTLDLAMLQSSETATLDMLTGAPATGTANDTIHISVRVTNNTGHKLPTGFEDARVMWLQVLVNGRVISGDYQNDALIEDPQLRAYRFVPGHRMGGSVMPENHIALHDTVLEDTRIPPAGMIPDARTMPVGRDYSGGAGGTLNNFDTATFAVPLPPTNGLATITVRLLYQFTTFDYVAGANGIVMANHTDNRGMQLLSAYNATGRAAPIEMRTVSTTVQVTGGVEPDAGVVDGGDASADAQADVGMDGGTGTTTGCHCRATPGRSQRADALVTLGLASLALVLGARRKRTRSSR